jgi:hypothetical protein
MKLFLFILFVFAFPPMALAQRIERLEVSCWSSGIDDEGNFLCRNLLVMGHEAGQFRVLSLAAVDEGGPKSRAQADLACAAMGFGFAAKLELGGEAGQGGLALINSDLQTAELYSGEARATENLSCFF